MSYEQFLAALCIWREARGSSPEAWVAIWHVLLNRVNNPKAYGQGLAGVILKPYQFSSFNKDDPNSHKLPNPAFPADYAPFPKIMDVVMDSLSDDPTNGATHYESVNPDQLELVKWADPSKITLRVGPFRFYRL